MFDLIKWTSLIVTVLLSCGCSDQPERYPVSGKVLIDGKPLAMGTIRFVPKSGRPATSAIREDGSFRLSEHSLSSSRLTEGVIPGVYRVSVTAAKVIDEDTDEVEWLVPSQYADFRTSGIELKVDSPRDDLVIDLISQTEESNDEQNASGDEVEVTDDGREVSKE